MTAITDRLAVEIGAALQDADGVVRLYPPAGRIPLLATATAALQTAAGQPQPLVAVTRDGDTLLVRAALGISSDVTPAALLRELTHTIRGHLTTVEPGTADTARIDLTVVRITP
jgi:hypothetical protein